MSNIIKRKQLNLLKTIYELGDGLIVGLQVKNGLAYPGEDFKLYRSLNLNGRETRARPAHRFNLERILRSHSARHLLGLMKELNEENLMTILVCNRQPKQIILNEVRFRL